MTKLLRVLILTILGAMLPTTAGLAQDVTTDILENAQDYSDRWVTYGRNYGCLLYTSPSPRD